MTNRTFTFAVRCGLVLFAGAALTAGLRPAGSHAPVALSGAVQAADVGFSVLPDGRGGTNVESILYTKVLDAMKDIIVGKAAYVGRFRQ